VALVVVGSGKGCFYRWVVLLNVSNCGGTDVVVVVGGSDIAGLEEGRRGPCAKECRCSLRAGKGQKQIFSLKAPREELSWLTPSF